MNADPELLSEQSYLVARGVRPLALVGWCTDDPDVMLRTATLVEQVAAEATVPFVVDHGDGRATYGYAANASVLDLYAWAQSGQDIPQCQRERIVGLLLGYAPAALASFDAVATGRRFATALPAPASTSQPCGTGSTAGTSHPR